MRKYNCSICNAGCHSADEGKTLCAECEKDQNLVEVVWCQAGKHYDTENCPVAGVIWGGEDGDEEHGWETDPEMKYCSAGVKVRS